MKTLRTLITLALLATGVLLIGDGLWIHAKAWLAQQLMTDAWQRARAGEHQPKPWPWADTWPLARLTSSRLDVDQYVLAGTSGRTLAFGPGHHDGSAVPGQQGRVVLTGHRDTHFRWLEDLRAGDVVDLLPHTGDALRYAVIRGEVVHETDTTRIRPEAGPGLVLVTCYPFDAIAPGGEWRYLVEARPVEF